jgi:hypothetical protein
MRTKLSKKYQVNVFTYKVIQLRTIDLRHIDKCFCFGFVVSIFLYKKRTHSTFTAEVSSKEG